MMRTFARCLCSSGEVSSTSLQDIAPVQEILQLAERATPMHILETLTRTASIPKEKNREENATSCRARQSAGKNLAKAKGARSSSRRKSTGRIFHTQKAGTGADDRRGGAACGGLVATYSASLQVGRQRFLAQLPGNRRGVQGRRDGLGGLRDYCIYMEAMDPRPSLLQIKEEATSAYASYVEKIAPIGQPSRPIRDAAWSKGSGRCSFSRPFLGWTTIQGRITSPAVERP